MKRYFPGIIAAVVLISVSAQAGLWVTPIDNPSFEFVQGGTQPTTGWGYEIDDWYENEQGTDGVADIYKNFWESGSDIGLAGDGALWAGTETGGAFYQPVGTVDGSATYSVSLLIGARWGTSFDVGAVSLYGGGTAGDAADGVDVSSFAAQLATVNITVDDGIQVADNVYAVTVDLTTAGGNAGDLLWLDLRSISGKDYFDNVTITPEPATMALLGLGGLGLLRKRRA